MTDFTKSSGDIYADLNTTPPVMRDLTYDHNGHVGLPISYAHLSDREMAGKVRMLMRHDLGHEGIVVGARDRILGLSKRLAELEAMIEQMAGALNFILAFYEPGQTYLDTNAWTQAEAGGRKALADAKAAGFFGG